MCCFYWLMNKETCLAYSNIELSQAECWEKEGKVRERSHGVTIRYRYRNFADRQPPHGDAQINGDGLN